MIRTILYFLFCFIFSVSGVFAKETTLCIAPFANNSGEKRLDGLAVGFADLLMHGFSHVPNIKIVERERFQSILNEHSISLRGLVSPETAIAVGRLLSADYVITGGIIRSQQQLIIVAHVFDIASFKVIASLKMEGKFNDMIPTALRLARKINVRLLPQIAPTSHKDFSTDPVGELYFMSGLGFFYTGNFNQAIMEFMKTIRRDPDHDASVYFTARSYFATKDYRHAIIECKSYLTKWPNGRYAGKSRALRRLCNQHLPQPK